MERVELKVEGMSCGHCKSSVERLLKEAAGVENINVSLEKGSAEVTIDENKITKQELIKKINDTGMYTAS
jgi:copper chaperone